MEARIFMVYWLNQERATKTLYCPCWQGRVLVEFTPVHDGCQSEQQERLLEKKSQSSNLQIRHTST